MRWSILLVCAVLAACATPPAAPLRPDQLFNDAAFQALLAEMIGLVRSSGQAVPDDELVTSDVVVPPADTTLAEAAADFSGDGLLPG